MGFDPPFQNQHRPPRPPRDFLKNIFYEQVSTFLVKPRYERSTGNNARIKKWTQPPFRVENEYARSMKIKEIHKAHKAHITHKVHKVHRPYVL